MQLARAIHFDDSDRQVFHAPARTGEWCIPGGFEFSDWSEADLAGKAKQAFTNGWLGVETFGRVSFVAVTKVEPSEMDTLAHMLARHFVSHYGAPDIDAARPVARQQIDDMAELCSGHPPNTLLAVTRELTEAGVRESFRAIEPPEADLMQFAVHGETDGLEPPDLR